MFDEYTINLEKIAYEKDMSPVTRTLALDLMKNPYLSPGDYFQSLTDAELSILLEMVESKDDGTLENEAEVLLLSQMLARAEGVVTDSIDEIVNHMSYLAMLVASVSLARKGLVKVNYENLSFGSDMMDKIVVEKI